MNAGHQFAATLLLSLLLWSPSMRSALMGGSVPGALLRYLLAFGFSWLACSLFFGLLRPPLPQVEEADQVDTNPEEPGPPLASMDLVDELINADLDG